jgi:hypothetical protein
VRRRLGASLTEPDEPHTPRTVSMHRGVAIASVVVLLAIGFAIGHNYASDAPEDGPSKTAAQRALESPNTPHVPGPPVGIPHIDTRPTEQIMLIGDSDMEFAAPYLQVAFAKMGFPSFRLQNTAIAGSGIGNPNRYDWLVELPRLLALHKPKIVIAHFYGNFASPELNYERALKAVDIIKRAGATSIWIIPAVPDIPEPGARDYVRTAQLFAKLPATLCSWRANLTPTEKWSKYAIFPDGKAHRLWIDGAHLSHEGNQLVAEVTAACVRPLIKP